MLDKGSNLEKTEIVYSESDLKCAMKQKYGTIVVKGEVAEKIYKNIDRNPKLRKISNWSIIIGIFFWPLLLAGIAGKVLTATDFKEYQIKEVKPDELIIVRKGKKI